MACRFELKEVVLGQLGLTDVMLAALLGSSPVFDRLEHGLYCVIGRRVGDTAVNAARRRLRERNSPQTAASPDLGPDEFMVRVTEASLKNEQYHVPARFHTQLAGKRHRAFTTEGGPTVEARVSQSGALAGVNRLIPHVRHGDHYCISVLPDGLGPELPGLQLRQLEGDLLNLGVLEPELAVLAAQALKHLLGECCDGLGRKSFEVFFRERLQVLHAGILRAPNPPRYWEFRCWQRPREPVHLQTCDRAHLVQSLPGQARADLLEIIDDRAAHKATIITSQLPIEHWHAWIGDVTIADAILDRLMQRNHRFTLTGESLRQGAKTPPKDVGADAEMSHF